MGDERSESRRQLTVCVRQHRPVDRAFFAGDYREDIWAIEN